MKMSKSNISRSTNYFILILLLLSSLLIHTKLHASCWWTPCSIFNIDFQYVCPYAGFDGQYRWVNPNNKDNFRLAGAGPRIFTMSQLANKSYPGFNAYFGLRYEWMGLEFGGHYGSGEKTLGPLELITRFAGGYIDLVGYIPTPAECLELMGTLGLGYTASRTSFSIPGGGGFSLSTQSGIALPRLRLGANYMFNYWAGVRALVGYETTHLLKAHMDDAHILPYGDSLLGSLGFFVKF